MSPLDLAWFHLPQWLSRRILLSLSTALLQLAVESMGVMVRFDNTCVKMRSNVSLYVTH